MLFRVSEDLDATEQAAFTVALRSVVSQFHFVPRVRPPSSMRSLLSAWVSLLARC